MFSLALETYEIWQRFCSQGNNLVEGNLGRCKMTFIGEMTKSEQPHQCQMIYGPQSLHLKENEAALLSLHGGDCILLGFLDLALYFDLVCFIDEGGELMNETKKLSPVVLDSTEDNFICCTFCLLSR